MEEDRLKELVEKHAPNFGWEPNGKVKCQLNGHCFPPKYDVIRKFIEGKKYARLIAEKSTAQALSRFEPFIVPSKNFPKMLYCKLTGQLLGFSEFRAQQHTEGRKFKKAKEAYDAGKKTLEEEPDIDDLMGEMEGLAEPESSEGMFIPDEDIDDMPSASQRNQQPGAMDDDVVENAGEPQSSMVPEKQDKRNAKNRRKQAKHAKRKKLRVDDDS